MLYNVNVLNLCEEKNHSTNFELIKTHTDTSYFVGNGFFQSPFSKDKNDFDRTGLCSAKVIFKKKQGNAEQWIDKTTNREWNLQIYCYQQYGFKIPELVISVICEAELYEKIGHFVSDTTKISISFEVFNWENYEENLNENSFNFALAKISNFDISSQSVFHSNVLADCQVKDIENYLIRTNCHNSSSGQVAEICKEFAESFRHVPTNINKNELLDGISSLIKSYRNTFHSHLNDEDEAKIKSFKEQYDFEFDAYGEKYAEEFKKITNKKDGFEAIKISNHLWSWRKAEYMFRNGYPFSSDEASYLTDEYLKLENIHSKTCERILFDVLLSSHISEYAYSAQINQFISIQALQSIQFGFYKPETTEFKSKSPLGIAFEFLFNSTFHLFGRVISGLISWFISGLIAGNNETARIVLFGTMFAADTVLMGLYKNHKLKNDKLVDSAKEEQYFNLIKNMCTLHSSAFVMDVKLMRHMLNELASSGVSVQLELLQLLSAIENRKRA